MRSFPPRQRSKKANAEGPKRSVSACTNTDSHCLSEHLLSAATMSQNHVKMSLIKELQTLVAITCYNKITKGPDLKKVEIEEKFYDMFHGRTVEGGEG